MKFHLDDHDGAKGQMRANINAWWPFVEQGVERIVINASGCGTTVKDYGHILREEPPYADKARRISELACDLSELLPELAVQLREKVRTKAEKIVFHPPCSLQHGQQIRGLVERHLSDLGFQIRLNTCEAHLCCGSAGTYSVLQPDLAITLRNRKLGHLLASYGSDPVDQVVSANIGCITHLQSGTAVPVRHWVELLDEALQA